MPNPIKQPETRKFYSLKIKERYLNLSPTCMYIATLPSTVMNPSMKKFWVGVFAVKLGLGVCTAQTQPVSFIPLIEAVRGTLASNTNVRLQERQVDFAKGALEQASSQFDPVFGANVSLNRDKIPVNSQQQAQGLVNSLRTDNAAYGISLSKQLRNGTILETTLSSSRTVDTVGKLSGLPTQNLGRLNFSVQVPLGKGSNSIAFSAGEAFAEWEADASKRDLQHTVAQSVLSTVLSYWNLVAAGKNLTIAQEAESTLNRLREELENLIAADERPAADLILVNANLTGKVLQRIDAERALLEAQQDLGRLIGISSDLYSKLQPSDDFPSDLPNDVWNIAEIDQLRDYALQHRADLNAAQFRGNAVQILTEAARYNLKPQIDLKFSLGIASVNETNALSGALWPYTKNPVGPSGGVTLTYQWPFSNRSAQAVLTQQVALKDQNDLRVAEITNAISAGVEAAFKGALLSARQLRESVNSLGLYGRAVANERIKLRLGQSTLVDVLNVNDSLLAARASNVAYQTSYLSSLVRLRFETATLLVPTTDGQSITFDRLIMPPMATK